VFPQLPPPAFLLRKRQEIINILSISELGANLQLMAAEL